MPNVTNVVLTLQHGGSTDPLSSRTVRVNFTTQFNNTERLAGTVFKATAVIRPMDDSLGNPISVGSAIIKAENTSEETVLTRTVTRRSLDEDFDSKLIGRPPHLVIREDIDEWVAEVTISPVVFGSATANSEIVTGSWGSEGSN